MRPPKPVREPPRVRRACRTRSPSCSAARIRRSWRSTPRSTQAIRDSDLEVRRAASVALVKNIRAEGLLLEIETEEAELSHRTAVTAMQSAFLEVAALAQDKARAVGLMVEDSPENALTRPHFLQARLEAASRVLPARERTIRRVYLALRALEYELNQELPALRDTLAAARSPEDIAGLSTCLAGIAEDYRLEHGYGQPYVTEVSLRADIFGITADIPDVDGSPATPAEQFAALLQDPLHARRTAPSRCPSRSRPSRTPSSRPGSATTGSTRSRSSSSATFSATRRPRCC
jgi:hypothetical protein